MMLRPEFFDIYLELAVEFRLPIRLPSAVSEHDAGFPFRHLADDEGVVFPDHFVPAWRAGSRERVEKAVLDLEPGVTEIHVQPADRHPRGAGVLVQLGGVGRRSRPRRPRSRRCAGPWRTRAPS